MRRLAMVLLAVVFIAGLAKAGFAGEVGPVKPLGKMKSEIAVEYNRITDKDLDNSGGIADGQVEESKQVYAKYSLGIADNFNVYAKLGRADYKQKVTWNATGSNRSQTISYDDGFLCGIGVNGLYDLGHNVGIGGDVQWNKMWFKDADAVTGDNSPVFIDRGSLETCESQAAAYLTYTMEMGSNLKVIPYGGGYYSHFKTCGDDDAKYQDTLNTYTVGDLKGEDNFGWLVGANVAAGSNITLNVEGRFIAETAITAGASYKF